MEQDAPNHYRQFVMNSFEEMSSDDYVFNFPELTASRKLDFTLKQGFGHKIMGFDIARYGNDKCVGYGLVQCNSLQWSEFHVEDWGKVGGDETEGRIRSICRAHGIDDRVIDEDGLGGFTFDYLNKEAKKAGLPPEFIGFRNPNYSIDDNKFYGNPRTEAAFNLKDLVSKGHIRIQDESTIQELMTLRYRFLPDGRRILISKEELRKEGIKSPNRADALLMASSLIKGVFKKQENIYRPRQAQVSQERSLFNLAGVR
jgi:hypothetical protein